MCILYNSQYIQHICSIRRSEKFPNDIALLITWKLEILKLVTCGPHSLQIFVIAIFSSYYSFVIGAAGIYLTAWMHAIKFCMPAETSLYTAAIFVCHMQLLYLPMV